MMKTIKSLQATRWLSVLAVCAACAAPLAAQAQDADAGGLPQALHQGDVTFVTGGVGLDESQALRTEAPRWPLAMRFTGSGADYLADVHVKITSGADTTVLQADSRGPYMLVQLRPGKYTVKATYDGHDQTRSITIGRKGHQKLDFSWSEM